MKEPAENIDSPQTPGIDEGAKPKLFSPHQVLLGAFLGGPPAAIYFIKKNFDVLENHQGVRNILLFGTIFTITILGVLFFLPEKSPNIIMPLIYSWLAYYIVEHFQLSKQKIIDSATYRFESAWKVVSVGFISLIAFSAIIIVLLSSIGSKIDVSKEMVTYDQIPASIKILENTHKEKAFVVFAFHAPINAKNDDSGDINLEYRIINGKTTFLWLCLSKKNSMDKEAIKSFAAANGISLIEKTEGGVTYLLSQDNGITELGIKIIRDFYKVDPKTELSVFRDQG